MNIKPYLSQIQACNPLSQHLYYNSEMWVKYKFENPNIPTKILFITKKYPKSISRENIIDYLRSPEKELLTGFLMTMIWGHGASEHGKMDNRGPYKVNIMTSDIANTYNVLENCYTALINNDIKSAFESFNTMKKIKVNFFSKFLYFLGRSLNIEKYPLIFDARVASAMCKLNSIDNGIFNILTIAPGQKYVSYESYMNIMHELSISNIVDAEKIEYYLFLNS